MVEVRKEIDGEQTYPIYSIDAYWHQVILDNAEYKENWTIGLPEGRFWNASGFRKMYKEEPNIAEVRLLALDWWGKYKRKKLKGKKQSVPILQTVVLEWETWNLTWFQHETFDIGQTDQEALDSFERFVDRKVTAARQEGKEPCLMGAEDRWRWSGAEPSGHYDDRSNPPCRCKHCKKQGVIRIGH